MLPFSALHKTIINQQYVPLPLNINHIGELLILYREKHNLSVDQLSSILGTKVFNVQNWEKGRCKPNNKMWFKLQRTTLNFNSNIGLV